MRKESKYSLKELRARRNYTQERMANELNVSRQRYIKIEKDPSIVSCKIMVRVANILDVDIGEIKI